MCQSFAVGTIVVCSSTLIGFVMIGPRLLRGSIVELRRPDVNAER